MRKWTEWTEWTQRGRCHRRGWGERAGTPKHSLGVAPWRRWGQHPQALLGGATIGCLRPRRSRLWRGAPSATDGVAAASSDGRRWEGAARPGGVGDAALGAWMSQVRILDESRRQTPHNRLVLRVVWAEEGGGFGTKITVDFFAKACLTRLGVLVLRSSSWGTRSYEGEGRRWELPIEEASDVEVDSWQLEL